jgi:hypothetical protein
MILGFCDDRTDAVVVVAVAVDDKEVMVRKHRKISQG